MGNNLGTVISSLEQNINFSTKILDVEKSSDEKFIDMKTNFANACIEASQKTDNAEEKIKYMNLAKSENDDVENFISNNKKRHDNKEKRTNKIIAGGAITILLIKFGPDIVKAICELFDIKFDNSSNTYYYDENDNY